MFIQDIAYEIPQAALACTAALCACAEGGGRARRRRCALAQHEGCSDTLACCAGHGQRLGHGMKQRTDRTQNLLYIQPYQHVAVWHTSPAPPAPPGRSSGARGPLCGLLQISRVVRLPPPLELIQVYLTVAVAVHLCEHRVGGLLGHHHSQRRREAVHLLLIQRARAIGVDLREDFLDAEVAPVFLRTRWQRAA
jgi:hypothetical protein